jgi:hypothetical protein
MVAAESANILAEADRNARNLGLHIQDRDDFRQAFTAADADAVSAVLDSQLNHAPMPHESMGVIAYYAYDVDARLLGQAGLPGVVKTVGAGTVLCPDLITKARVRSEPLLQQPLYELCLSGGLPYLASLVPIGEAEPAGYLQVVTDPVPELLRIGRRLKMPVQVSSTEGAIMHTGSGWIEARTDHEVMSEYVLTANNSRRRCILQPSVMPTAW